MKEDLAVPVANGGANTAASGSHTPGPWIVKRDTGLRQRIQTSGDKGTLCYMTARPFAHGANFSHEQITANAKLIAAAPELVSALRSCEYEIFACLSDDSVKANPDVLSALQTAYDAARAALAKL